MGLGAEDGFGYTVLFLSTFRYLPVPVLAIGCVSDSGVLWFGLFLILVVLVCFRIWGFGFISFLLWRLTFGVFGVCI